MLKSQFSKDAKTSVNVENIIFDLDNTLYSSDAAMDSGITHRMMTAVADFFCVSENRASQMRNENLPKFSTTLEWLRSEGLSDTEKYFAQVHPPNEVCELEADSNLRPALLALSQKKVILTNAPMEHAVRVLQKLNVEDLFCGIVDIRACNLRGKPYKSSYEKALEKLGGAATLSNTIFVDDQMKYIHGFASLGGVAVLVQNDKKSKCEFQKIEGFCEKGEIFRINSIYFLQNLLNKI